MAHGRCSEQPEVDGNGGGPGGDYRIRGHPQPPVRRNGDGPETPGPGLAEMGPGEVFGRAVRYLRRGRRVRQIDLAARAAISLGRLSEIERGEYVAWRRAADRLAHALDFADAAELLLRFYGKDLPAADARSLLDDAPDGDSQ